MFSACPKPRTLSTAVNDSTANSSRLVPAWRADTDQHVARAFTPCNRDDLSNRLRRATEAILRDAHLVLCAEESKGTEIQQMLTGNAGFNGALGRAGVRDFVQILQRHGNAGSHALADPTKAAVEMQAHFDRIGLAALRALTEWYYAEVRQESVSPFVQAAPRYIAPPQIPVADLPVNERKAYDERHVADRYTVQRVLGFGCGAVVYLAVDIETGDRVALKILRAEQLLQPGAPDRFRREAAQAARYAHDRLVGMSHVFDLSDGRPCIVMDLVEGGTLASRMAEGIPDRQLALQWISDLLEGLAHLHSCRGMHGNLDPENVLTTLDGRLCLADLDTVGTRDGNYAAPEQRLAPEHRRPASDVFAAALLSQLILTGVPYPPGKGVSGELGVLLRRMADIDPDTRPTAKLALATVTSLLDEEANRQSRNSLPEVAESRPEGLRRDTVPSPPTQRGVAALDPLEASIRACLAAGLEPEARQAAIRTATSLIAPLISTDLGRATRELDRLDMFASESDAVLKLRALTRLEQARTTLANEAHQTRTQRMLELALADAREVAFLDADDEEMPLVAAYCWDALAKLQAVSRPHATAQANHARHEAFVRGIDSADFTARLIEGAVRAEASDLALAFAIGSLLKHELDLSALAALDAGPWTNVWLAMSCYCANKWKEARSALTAASHVSATPGLTMLRSLLAIQELAHGGGGLLARATTASPKALFEAVLAPQPDHTPPWLLSAQQTIGRVGLSMLDRGVAVQLPEHSGLPGSPSGALLRLFRPQIPTVV
jgi:hypothetical protein